MRIRVVGSGIIAGLFCLAALWFPWYMIEPAGLARGWMYEREAANFPAWLSTGVAVFCALTVFAFGWVAARWNWAKTWRSSLLDGAGAGLIAGCVVFDFIGAFHFGLAGQADILKAFYREVGENEGLALLFDSLSATSSLVYLNFIAILFAALCLGALGGLASAIDLEDVWGSPPREPHRWLFRLPAYTLSLTGVGWLVLTIAVFSVFQDVLNEAVTTAAETGDLSGLTMPPFFVSTTAYLTGVAMTLPAIGLTWGWIVRAWRGAGLWKPFYLIWVAASVYAVGWAVNSFIRYVSTGMVFEPFVFSPITILWIAAIGSLAFGFLAGALLSDDSPATGGGYNFYDWLGYALTQGILGGTQAFMGVPAFALAVSLIAIENIPHLTQTGIVDISPALQVIRLFKALTVGAQALIVACAIGGWFFGLVVLWVRKFLKIQPVEGSPATGETQSPAT